MSVVMTEWFCNCKDQKSSHTESMWVTATFFNMLLWLHTLGWSAPLWPAYEIRTVISFFLLLLQMWVLDSLVNSNDLCCPNSKLTRALCPVHSTWPHTYRTPLVCFPTSMLDNASERQLIIQPPAGHIPATVPWLYLLSVSMSSSVVL